MPARTKPFRPRKAAHAQLSLWSTLGALIADITPGRAHKKTPKNRPQPTKTHRKPAANRPAGPPAGAPTTRMGRIYHDMAHELPERYGITVIKWRTSNSGVAILRKLNNGRWLREMEAPYPRGPVSAAVFCHEIAHHAIGVGSISPRCREEHAAWMWALDELRNRGVNVTTNVQNRVYDSLHHAVHVALRRGLKQVPAELVPYLPPRPTRRANTG